MWHPPPLQVSPFFEFSMILKYFNDFLCNFISFHEKFLCFSGIFHQSCFSSKVSLSHRQFYVTWRLSGMMMWLAMTYVYWKIIYNYNFWTMFCLIDAIFHYLLVSLYQSILKSEKSYSILRISFYWLNEKSNQ